MVVVRMIAGVDEAGRGPVIGPLVVAAVLVDEEQEEKLRSLGVRDSKKVSPNRREELANMIKRVVTSYSVVVVEPAEIDQAVRRKNLNRLEAEKFAEAINNLSSMPDRVIVDSADNNPERFRDEIKKYVSPGIDVVAEHRADQNHVVVGAASILAKVVRDREINRLREKYPGLGSGYPSDPETQTFVEEWMKTHRDYPPFIRQSWKTIKKHSRGKQTDLTHFGSD